MLRVSIWYSSTTVAVLVISSSTRPKFCVGFLIGDDYSSRLTTDYPVSHNSQRRNSPKEQVPGRINRLAAIGNKGSLEGSLAYEYVALLAAVAVILAVRLLL